METGNKKKRAAIVHMCPCHVGPTIGFTVVEMSIGLVIIGLVMGAIVIGQALVRAAEVRATVRDFQTFETAVQTFRGKYNCLPGDCAEASTFGLASAAGPNGNGDSIICYNALIEGQSGSAVPGPDTECAGFWEHLANASLIQRDWPGDATFIAGLSSPRLKVPVIGGTGIPGGWFTAYFSAYSRHMMITLMGSFNGDPLGGSLRPVEAYAIDSKIDDGLPDSGSARAGTSDSWFSFLQPTAGAMGSQNCVNSGTTPRTYNFGATDSFMSACSVGIKTNF